MIGEASAPTSPSPSPTRTSRSPTDDAVADRAGADQVLGVRRGPVRQLLVKTQRVRRLYKAGDQDDAARALYADARTHWERIETVAESFGDLDPKMDAREADLEPGQEWTGWHRDREGPVAGARREVPAVDPRRSGRRTPTICSPTPRCSTTRIQDAHVHRSTQIGNGSHGLLEEVATGKVTGEEEYWSHTDLWDFQANVDGARRQRSRTCRPVLEVKDPELADELVDPLRRPAGAARPARATATGS